MQFLHQPVMVSEVLEYLSPKNGDVFVDGTLGAGGHALALARKFKVQSSKFKIIGIDQDLEAIFAAKKNLAGFDNSVIFIHDNFSNLPAILKSQGIDKVDGIFLDLGVSSYQLEKPDRGFSFQNDAPLDMRMNQSDDFTAGEIINYYDEKKLANLFYQYGGERNSRKIAKNIIEARKKDKITTTGRLVKIIELSFPARYKNKYKIHPATRVFQALRIEVNDELKVLEDFIPKAAELLAGDGRLIIISFHSLEDRIVKHSFRDLAEKYPEKYKHHGLTPHGVFNALSSPPAKLPLSCYKVLTKKPLTPTEEEITANPRSRSAKLRVLKNVR